jgi:hypothetical protein
MQTSGYFLCVESARARDARRRPPPPSGSARHASWARRELLRLGLGLGAQVVDARLEAAFTPTSA